MDHATGKSIRHDLLDGMNSLRVACEALALPLLPSQQAIYLDDIGCACDSLDRRLDELSEPCGDEMERAAPFQWLMDPLNYPTA